MFSQEIRTETRISNFNLKGDLVRNIYVWGGGIFGGGGGGGGVIYSVLYTEGGYVPYFFLMGDFIQVNRFFILFT